MACSFPQHAGLSLPQIIVVNEAGLTRLIDSRKAGQADALQPGHQQKRVHNRHVNSDVDMTGYVPRGDGIQNRRRERQHPGDGCSCPPIEHECDPRNDERQQARDDGPEESLGREFIMGARRVTSQIAQGRGAGATDALGSRLTAFRTR